MEILNLQLKKLKLIDLVRGMKSTEKRAVDI